MGSSIPSRADPDALRRLGAFATGSEARQIAERLEAGATLTAALRAVGQGRRHAFEDALADCLLGREDGPRIAEHLRAVEGARSTLRTVHPVWTMPGHLARSAPLTTSVVQLVDGARQSVTWSTFNVQTTSALWEAVRRAAGRHEVEVRVYLDARAAGGSSPTPEQVASLLHPATVMASTTFGGAYVRNHAKFVVVDHRWLLVTSANASWSAEQANVELGLLVDDTALAESVEAQMREAEAAAYQRITVGDGSGYPAHRGER